MKLNLLAQKYLWFSIQQYQFNTNDNISDFILSYPYIKEYYETKVLSRITWLWEYNIVHNSIVNDFLKYLDKYGDKELTYNISTKLGLIQKNSSYIDYYYNEHINNLTQWIISYDINKIERENNKSYFVDDMVLKIKTAEINARLDYFKYKAIDEWYNNSNERLLQTLWINKECFNDIMHINLSTNNINWFTTEVVNNNEYYSTDVVYNSPSELENYILSVIEYFFWISSDLYNFTIKFFEWWYWLQDENYANYTIPNYFWEISYSSTIFTGRYIDWAVLMHELWHSYHYYVISQYNSLLNRFIYPVQEEIIAHFFESLFWMYDKDINHKEQSIKRKYYENIVQNWLKIILFQNDLINLYQKDNWIYPHELIDLQIKNIHIDSASLIIEEKICNNFYQSFPYVLWWLIGIYIATEHDTNSAFEIMCIWKDIHFYDKIKSLYSFDYKKLWDTYEDFLLRIP